jgi:multicomponent Na+:H+ antiporter subunit F
VSEPGSFWFLGAVNAVMIILVVALFLCFFRLVKGPTLPDRVVAFDLIVVIMIGLFVLFAITARQPVLMDAALVVALVGFVATVAFARFMERRARDE